MTHLKENVLVKEKVIYGCNKLTYAGRENYRKL